MGLKSARKYLQIGLLFLVTVIGCAEASKTHCGFPGTPAFGYVKPDINLYEEGDIVTYTCRIGYIMLGSPIRRCKDDSTWTEQVPICDDSMTTLGFASATAAVPGHPAEYAIDRNKDSCTHLLPKKTRWWRIDLGAEHKILSVAITIADTDKYTKFTVFVIKIRGTSASYKRCASFSGKFGASTVVLTCADGKGIHGQRVHIEDHIKTEGLFEVCEIEIQVEKDNGYECGRADRNPHSITYDVKGAEVEYSCFRGYKLNGRDFRTCLNNGQWAGNPPKCEESVCEPLPPLRNGQLMFSSIDDDDDDDDDDVEKQQLEGAVASFKCSEGYKLIGGYNRVCGEHGAWSGKQPYCEVVRCIVPDGSSSNGIYALLNGTTRMGSVALLKCRRSKMEGTNPFIVCKDDGEWSESEARCLIPSKAVAAAEDMPKIVNYGAVIFGMIVSCVMMTIILVSLYVRRKRRNRSRRPELPIRQMEVPTAPPRPPPRAKPVQQIASTLFECVSGRSANDSYIRNDSRAETRSLQPKHLETKVSAQKTSVMDNDFVRNAEHVRLQTESCQGENSTEEDKTTNTDEDESSSLIETQAGNKEPKNTKKNVADPKAAKEYAAVHYEKKKQPKIRRDHLLEYSEEEESLDVQKPMAPKDTSKQGDIETEDGDDSGRSKQKMASFGTSRRTRTHTEETPTGTEERPRGFRRTRATD